MYGPCLTLGLLLLSRALYPKVVPWGPPGSLAVALLWPLGYYWTAAPQGLRSDSVMCPGYTGLASWPGDLEAPKVETCSSGLFIFIDV